MNKCLWCKAETDGLFCIGGGVVQGNSFTGEKGFTKSYCLHSFLAMLKGTEETKLPYIDAEQEYLKYEPDIKTWYKSIPYYPYKRGKNGTV